MIGQEMDKGLVENNFRWTFSSLNSILVSPASTFCNWENRTWFSSSATLNTGNQQLITFVPKPAHAASCSVPSWAMICGLGRGGSTRGQNVMEITNYEVNCDQWRVSHISRVYPTDMSFKMCIVCILFLLTVHRLVLIVNSWDVFGGNRRGGRLSPILLKHCFCSGLMNPSVCFYLYFPSVGGAERGVFSAKLKDMRSWGLWQREKITFPLEEKK